MSNYQIVSCRMSSGNHKALQDICGDMERSQSWVLNKAFELYREMTELKECGEGEQKEARS